MNVYDIIRKALECNRARSLRQISALCEEVRTATLEGVSDADKDAVLEMVESFEEYISITRIEEEEDEEDV